MQYTRVPFAELAKMYSYSNVESSAVQWYECLSLGAVLASITRWTVLPTKEGIRSPSCLGHCRFKST